MVNTTSVIIPAHNEEKSISIALSALLDSIKDKSIEVIVVCNGCTDNTSKIVKNFHKSIVCIETNTASKTNALNIGDTVASFFPRFYQDADVIVSGQDIKKIAEILRHDSAQIASPKMRMVFHNASWIVRSYYRLWQEIPYVQEELIGTGIYGLSEAGRARFNQFPNIISDDGFARAHFVKKEMLLIEDCLSLVTSPQNMKALLKIKTRSRRGQYQLIEKYPSLKKINPKIYSNSFLTLAQSISLWPHLAIYFFINLLTRVKAKKSLAKHTYEKWEKDKTSREAAYEHFKDK